MNNFLLYLIFLMLMVIAINTFFMESYLSKMSATMEYGFIRTTPL